MAGPLSLSLRKRRTVLIRAVEFFPMLMVLSGCASLTPVVSPHLVAPPPSPPIVQPTRLSAATPVRTGHVSEAKNVKIALISFRFHFHEDLVADRDAAESCAAGARAAPKMNASTRLLYSSHLVLLPNATVRPSSRISHIQADTGSCFQSLSGLSLRQSAAFHLSIHHPGVSLTRGDRIRWAQLTRAASRYFQAGAQWSADCARHGMAYCMHHGETGNLLRIKEWIDANDR